MLLVRNYTPPPKIVYGGARAPSPPPPVASAVLNEGYRAGGGVNFLAEFFTNER